MSDDLPKIADRELRDMRDMDERDVRLWFMKTDLAQAKDTFNVVAGIIETREAYQPKRKRRSDAGKPRTDQPSLMDVNPAAVAAKP